MKKIAIFALCLLLGACMFGTSQTAKFYTLPLPPTVRTSSADYTGFVGISRVQLPKYVDRPQIVTKQKDSAQITISEYNRWAEDLSVLTARALAEDLSALLPKAQIKASQSKGEEFDKIIFVEISKLDAVMGENAEITAWYMVKNSSKQVTARQKFTSTVQIGKTYDDVAKGYSELLGQLSQQIAASLLK